VADRNKFLAIVHIIAAEIGLADDAYRDMIEARWHVRTAARLTPYQLSQFIDELKRKRGALHLPGEGTCHPCRPRPASKTEAPPDEVRWPVTSSQERDIAQLRRNIHWGSSGGYLRWLMKYHKVLDVRDSRTAGKIIAGLRGLCMSQHHCRLCGSPEGITTRCHNHEVQL